MSQLELFDIPSPCVGVCQSDARGFCKGCLRSRDERFNWLYLSTEEKRVVIGKCAARKKRIALAIYKKRLEAAQAKTNQNQQAPSDLFAD